MNVQLFTKAAVLSPMLKCGAKTSVTSQHLQPSCGLCRFCTVHLWEARFTYFSQQRAALFLHPGTFHPVPSVLVYCLLRVSWGRGVRHASLCEMSEDFGWAFQVGSCTRSVDFVPKLKLL